MASKAEDKAYFEEQFSLIEKTMKIDLPLVEKKRSLFNGRFKLYDKVMEVAVLNAGFVMSGGMLSISFRHISETEVKKVLKEYTIVRVSRYPVIVERKYMEDNEYKDYRKIIEQEYL